ncbi:hypothetical protein JCM19235_6898 [Vibrio maritimus]|uniref:Uncharacterized protein n=1 Tax=Vibrio maritimus TaxID=990268 RepID=A0A090RSF0_9VIBR|nr:hypothetical protein JCM19235_6898 [Vibrio maritimus]
MKRAKLSLFRLMSDAEKWRAIEVAYIPTASAQIQSGGGAL